MKVNKIILMMLLFLFPILAHAQNTATMTSTNTATNTMTNTATQTCTNTLTNTATNTATITLTFTATPNYIPGLTTQQFQNLILLQEKINNQYWAQAYPGITLTPSVTPTGTLTPSPTPTPSGFYVGSCDSVSAGVSFAPQRGYIGLGIQLNTSHANSAPSTYFVYEGIGTTYGATAAATLILATNALTGFMNIQGSTGQGTVYGIGNNLYIKPAVTPTQTIVATYNIQFIYGPLSYYKLNADWYALCNANKPFLITKTPWKYIRQMS